jgi:hypothetical protein
VVIGVTLLIVALLGGGGFAAKRWFLDSGSTVETVPTTTIDETIDVEPVSSSPTRLFARKTDGGIEIRVHESDQNIFGMPAPIGADDRPGWCQIESTLMVSALSTDAVVQTQMPRSKEPSPKSAAMLTPGGVMEGSPLVLVVAQVGDDVTLARLSNVGGQSDSMEPKDGLVALAIALPAPDPNVSTTALGPDIPFGPFGAFGIDTASVAVEMLHGDGTSTRLTQTELAGGPPLWSDPACFQNEPGFFPEKLELPKPGADQPTDAAAERAAIEATLDDLYDNIDDDATIFRLVDDPSGIDLLMDGILKGEFGDDFRSMKVAVSDLIFFSPIEATFIYTTGLDLYNDGFSGEFPEYGRARLIDGVWHITRTTICQDIVKTGFGCQI